MLLLLLCLFLSDKSLMLTLLCIRDFLLSLQFLHFLLRRWHFEDDSVLFVLLFVLFFVFLAVCVFAFLRGRFPIDKKKRGKLACTENDKSRSYA